MSLSYKGLIVSDCYFPDLIVNGLVVVELKCVEEFAAEHEAQLLTYLKISGCRLGILLNFHAPLMKDGYFRRAL